MSLAIVGDVIEQVRQAVLAAIDGEITTHYWKWCINDGSGMHLWGRPKPGIKEVLVRPTSTKTVLAAVRNKTMELTYHQWPRSPKGLWHWILTYETDRSGSYVEYRFSTREDPAHFEQAAKAAKLRKEMMDELRKPRKPRQRKTIDDTL